MRYAFVDCRWDLTEPGLGERLYLDGHIPGASFLDVDRDLSDLSRAPEEGRHPLPSGEAFAAAAGAAGIGPGVLVVAYDQGWTGGAARLWWLLRHFGHADVAVLDGGIGAWHGPLESGRVAVRPEAFVPRPRHGDTISAEELLDRLAEPGLAIVDARAPERYRGDVEPLDPVRGHVPGAVNVPASAPEPPGRILEADEIAVYCGSGISACVDLLALARAGRSDARLYPGSFSEWSRRGLPVRRSG